MSKRTSMKRTSIKTIEKDMLFSRSISMTSVSPIASPRNKRKSKSYRRSSTRKSPHSPKNRPSPREKTPSYEMISPRSVSSRFVNSYI